VIEDDKAAPSSDETIAPGAKQQSSQTDANRGSRRAAGEYAILRAESADVMASTIADPRQPDALQRQSRDRTTKVWRKQAA